MDKKTEEVMRKAVRGIPLTKKEELLYEIEVSKTLKMINEGDKLLAELKEIVVKG